MVVRRTIWVSGLGLAALSICALGCGKLSKSEAEAKIRKAYFSRDSPWRDSLWCELDRHLEKSSVNGAYSNTFAEDCRKPLAAMRVIKMNVERSVGYGPWLTMRIAENGKMDGSKLSFPCGKRALKEIKSITTEEKRATVIYVRTVQVDREVLKTVAECPLGEVPKDGDSDRTVKFRKDDDGNWSLVD